MSREKLTLVGGKAGILYTHPLSCFPHSPPPSSKYPPVSSGRERSCYAAVFQDQYSEFLELQQELRSAQAKLQQLEALLTSLPPPHSQVSNQVETLAPQPFRAARPWLSAHPLGLDPQTLPSPAWAGTTVLKCSLNGSLGLFEPQFPHLSLGPALPQSPSSLSPHRRRLK